MNWRLQYVIAFITISTQLEGEEAVALPIILRALEEPIRQIAFNAGVEPSIVVQNVRDGEGGFGYDPIFVPDDGDGRTFGEWGEGKYTGITHRAKAMNSLAELLKPPSR